MSKKIEFKDLFDSSSFDEGTRAIASHIEKITKAINDAGDAADKLTKLFGDKLKGEIAQLSATSKNLATDMLNMSKKMDEFKNTTANTKKVIDEYERANEKLRKELEQLKNAQTEITKTTKKKSEGMKELAQSLIGVGSGAALLYRGIQGLGNQLRLAVESTLEFEQAMKEVQAISRASANELKLLTENANRLGATTEKTAGEIAKLQKELGKLGFNTTEILASTDAIVDLSTATGEDLAGSATVAAATLRAFGLDAVEMGRVVDVMAGSFVRSGLDLEKFRESMKLVAPIARATGVDIETTTAALSKLADAGLSGSLAGTALRNLLSSMADPSEKLTQYLGKLDNTLADGVKSSEDLIRAFKVLKSSGLDLATAVQMVDVRARPAFFTLMNQADAVEGLSLEYSLLDGEANNIAETMRDTLTNDIAIANSAFDALRRNVIEKVTPAMREGVQTFTTLSEVMRLFISNVGATYDVAEQAPEDGIISQILFGSGGSTRENEIFTLVKGLTGDLMGFFEKYVEVGKFLEQVEGLDISLAGASESMKSLSDDLEAFETVENIIKNAKDNTTELGVTFDNIVPVVNVLGEGFSDIKGHLQNGLDTEKATYAVRERLLRNLKDTVAVYEQNANQLANVEKRKKAIESTDGGIVKFQEEYNLLVAKQSRLDAFVRGNAKEYLKAKEYLNSVSIKIADVNTKDLETEKQKTKKLDEQIKLQYELNKAQIEGQVEILQNQRNLETDPVKIIQLEQQLAEKRIELANLKFKFELKTIEELYKEDKTYLTRRNLAYQNFLNDLEKLNGEFNNKISKVQEDSAKITDKNFQEVLKNSKKSLDKLAKEHTENKQQQADAQVRIEEDKWQKIEKYAQIGGQAISNITRSIFDNQAIARDNEMAAIDAWEQERIKMAGDNEEAIAAIEAEAEERRKKVRRDQAKADKKEALFQIAIATAVNIAKAGLKFWEIAILIAMGAAQAAVVAARPLPEFAKGTDDSPEGLAKVGERGRELVRDGRTGQWSLTPNKTTITYLTKHSQVIPNAQTEMILKGDHNGRADELLRGATIKQIDTKPDYQRIGQEVAKAVSQIPVNKTVFDENGVANFVVKKSGTIKRLNKRY